MLFTLFLACSLAEDPRVDDILEKAIEVQRLHEEAGNEVKYDYVLVSVTEKLDKNGGVKEVEERLYESDHIEGVAYERLVKKDGRALSEKERKSEAKREKDFRKKLDKGAARHNDADDRVTFDEELLARYDIVVEGTRQFFGREAYALSFSPKSGKLPQESRMDRVLNKASGSLWIDTETFQVAGVEFELMEPVKLWLGMVGSVSRMTGKIVRRPVSEDVWLPEKFDFYIQGRVLFRSLHLRQNVVWNEFEKREPKLAASPQSGSPEDRR